MEMLAANAQVVGAAKPGDASNSQCAKQCQSQQAAIVSCIDSIRDARESNSAAPTEESDPTHAAGKVGCLPPVVAAWTKCCSDANNDGATGDSGD